MEGGLAPSPAAVLLDALDTLPKEDVMVVMNEMGMRDGAGPSLLVAATRALQHSVQGYESRLLLGSSKFSCFFGHLALQLEWKLGCTGETPFVLRL
jgi:hypothetical protein